MTISLFYYFFPGQPFPEPEDMDESFQISLTLHISSMIK